MNNKFLAELTLVILCVVTLSSCFDKDLFDDDKRSDHLNWQPDYTMPAGYINYKLKDLLESSAPGSVFSSESEFLALEYRKNDIFSFDINDIVKIPDVQPVEKCQVDILPGDRGIPLTTLISLPKTEGYIEMVVYKEVVELSKIKADLKINLTGESLPIDYNIILSLPSVKDGGTTFSEEIEVEKGEPLAWSKPLEDVEIDCLGKTNALKYTVEIVVPSQPGTLMVDAEAIDVDLQISDCIISTAEGDFGEISLDLEKDIINMNVGLLKNFVDPKISFIAHYNSMNIPFAVDADFLGRNMDMSTARLREGYEETMLEFEGNSGDTGMDDESGITEVDDGIISGDDGDMEKKIEEERSYTEVNSNIRALFELPPDDGIEYEGKVNLNFGVLDRYNYISKTTKMNMDLLVELPLAIEEDGFVFRDTLMDIDISSDMTKDIDSLVMIVMFTTEKLPLEIVIQKINFYDESMKVIELWEGSDDILDVSEDEEKSKFLIPLPREIVDDLDKIKHIGMETRLSAIDKGGKIPIDAGIKLNIAFRAILDLSIK